MAKYFLLLFTNIFLLMSATQSQQAFQLYEGNSIPGNKDNISNTERTEIGEDRVERIFEVSIPTITVYQPKIKDKRGIGIIICPGGGYRLLSSDKEGKEIAYALNNLGITAFVLKYRIPSNDKNTDKSLAPLMDAQRAIQLVRQKGKEWGVDVHKIGIMGFSAGGHLAASASTHFMDELIDNPLKTSLRTDFSVLAYPVISFEDNLTHSGSKENLIKNAAFKSNKFYTNYDAATKFFSNEKNITSQTPPAFLFHAMDDGAVKVQNSIRYFEGLINNNVKNCELIIYPNGGHGFGLNLPNKNDQWIQNLKNWLDILFR